MKPTILKVFSNYPDRSYKSEKNDENHLIRISNVAKQNIPQIKCELLRNELMDNSFANLESSSDISVLEDYYRFQERRNAFMDSKKSVTQTNPTLQKRVYERPNYSYTQLIYMAIESSALNALTVNDIYKWCELNFPYYANAIHGWKNSLRHNLSINKCFKKITKMGQGGRGSLWIVDPREKQHLVSTMHRSNVTSFNNPSFIIHAEQSKIKIPSTGNQSKLPSKNKSNLTRCRSNSLVVAHIEEKPCYTWTDTRLPCDFVVTLSQDDCSQLSETDYNDWQRAMISPEPIFPAKRHQFSPDGPLYPIVTPPNSVEHNYSIPNFENVLEDPSYVVRHMFQPSVNSNVSYSTSSDYNDEEWPRTPSPVLVTATTNAMTTTIVTSNTATNQQQKPPSKPAKLFKPTKSKRGRPKNSTKQKEPIQIKKPLKHKVGDSQHERINNMYDLNNFINSL